MSIQTNLLIKKHFEENSLIQSNIDSFDKFIEEGFQEVIKEHEIIDLTIIPEKYDEYHIKLGRIKIGKPVITEADGSERIIMPSEARLRKFTYAAPVYLEMTSYGDNVKKEELTFENGKAPRIADIPIMLKSKSCYLKGLKEKELINNGEDPSDPGGYFIINGTEKVLVTIEDLAPNKLLVTKKKLGPSEYVGQIFSQNGSIRIPHKIEMRKNGIIYLTFTKGKRVPIFLVLKALGMLKDKDIMDNINKDNYMNDIIINMYNFQDIKTEEDAIDKLSKLLGMTQPKEVRMERMDNILDRFLLPHTGIEKENRYYKAQSLCRLIKLFLEVKNKDRQPDDKDHYMNKRLKLSGELLKDLIESNIKILINDMKYNFQRLVKRGRIPSLKIITREKLLSSRIKSAMATGNWIGGRTGVAQRIERQNFIQFLSHLQRVVSPLSSSQENFEARMLHPTQWGRLCPSETPEGGNIGLRKNLALLAKTTTGVNKEEKNQMSNRPVLVRLDLELDFARSIYRVDPFSRSNTIPCKQD